MKKSIQAYFFFYRSNFLPHLRLESMNILYKRKGKGGKDTLRCSVEFWLVLV